MGQTTRDYRMWEAAIAVEDCAPHTNGTKERKLAGDIIALRRPGTAIGRLERSPYLWLRLGGMDENDMARLTDGLDGFDKRRYCIPLARLAAVVPGFSVARALDAADAYQPFLPSDAEPPYAFLASATVLDVHGLVFDKETRRYL